MSQHQPKKSKQSSSSNDSYLIGIGTSAGGLEALKVFFDNVPSNCKHSFAIIQHLSPDYKSLMAEILSKNTKLPIHEVMNGMKVKEGSIYLIPTKKNMTYVKGKFILTDKPQNKTLNLPIDIFFRSMAEELKERSVAIILSGTGTDGSRGARAVKEAGGIVIVQDPNNAKFDGMPNSTIATGVTDYILPINEIPLELTNFLKSIRDIDFNEHNQIFSDKKTVNEILKYVHIGTNIDFSGYKRPTLLRRLARRMNINKCYNLSEYYDFIQKNQTEVNVLHREFMIGVTKFFRNPEAFESLKEYLSSEIIDKKNSKEEVKIWCVGCSSGEEVYSIAIIVDELLERANRQNMVKIFATDIDQVALEKASRGIYSESIAADITPTRLKKYFIKKGQYYEVNQKMRNQVIFSRHDVLKAPSFNKLDLITCRNLLIYLGTKVQKIIMSKFHYALHQNALLMLGTSESISQSSDLFRPINNKWRLYANQPLNPIALRDSIGSTTAYKVSTPSISSSKPHKKGNLTTNHLVDILNNTLLDQFGVAAIYVDHKYDMVHAVGNFKKYLEIPADQFSLNLLKMLPDDLSIATGTTLRRVAKEKDKVMYKGAKWKDGDYLRDINIHVKAYTLENDAYDNYLVIFQQEKVSQNTHTVIKDLPLEEKAMSSIIMLREELEETKDNLQATIEQVETSNEELQAINQELMSSNEELQSTNEELQSVNEELHTVNSELQLKIEELVNVNYDMNNLMNSTEIGTIFLDKELRIRKYTPNITYQFNLQESDVGRLITDFTSKFGADNSEKFKSAIIKVTNNGKPDQREIQTEDGTWYLQRIFPFVERENLFNGVVITFINIMDLKKAYESADTLAKELNELEVSNATLSRFNKAAIGRENRMIELKEEVNNLLLRLGETPAYELKFKDLKK